MNPAKKYLLQLHNYNNKIAQTMEQIEALRATASGVTGLDYSKDRVQVSPSDKMADVMAKLVDLENELYAELSEYREKKTLIENQIKGMDDPTLSKLLWLKYVEGLHLEEAAERMGYSFEWIRHKHGDALRKFERLYLSEQQKTTHKNTF